MIFRKNGQGLTEYVVIVALVAITFIGIVTLFGDQIRSMFSSAVVMTNNESKDLPVERDDEMKIP